jgi:hypothetical protein
MYDFVGLARSAVDFGAKWLERSLAIFKRKNEPDIIQNQMSRDEQLAQDSDEKLLARAAKGDIDALNELRRRAAPPQ